MIYLAGASGDYIHPGHVSMSIPTNLSQINPRSCIITGLGIFNAHLWSVNSPGVAVETHNRLHWPTGSFCLSAADDKNRKLPWLSLRDNTVAVQIVSSL